MAISRAPKAKPATADKPPAKPAVDVDAIINKGGSTPNSIAPKPSKARKGVLVNIPVSILEQIDAAVEAREIRTTRQTWFEEAFLEKLEAEKKAGQGRGSR